MPNYIRTLSFLHALFKRGHILLIIEVKWWIKCCRVSRSDFPILCNIEPFYYKNPEWLGGGMHCLNALVSVLILKSLSQFSASGI